MSDGILEIGRLRRLPGVNDLEQFQTRQVIIRGLLEMRREGIFRMVYCDDNKLAVVLPGAEDLSGSFRQQISWSDAASMVDAFRGIERKPAAREIRPRLVKQRRISKCG
jgi:hypothetical protein